MAAPLNLQQELTGTDLGPGAAILSAAAEIAGVTAEDAVLLRDGSNIMYRSGRWSPGSAEEVGSRQPPVRCRFPVVNAGIPVVRTVDTLPQPVVVDGRPVTWWAFIDSARTGSPADLAELLRHLHQVAVPDNLALPTHDPLCGLSNGWPSAPFCPSRTGRGWTVAAHDRGPIRDHLVRPPSRGDAR